MSDKSTRNDEVSAEAAGAVARNVYGATHLGEVPFDEVFPFVTMEKTRRAYVVGGQTYSVKLDSQRYHLFKVSRTCAACGLIGTKLMLDISPGARSPHFNLYGEEGDELVLMTQDHVVPASLGGPDTPENLRPMCSPCNVARGNNADLTLEQIRERRIVPRPKAVPAQSARVVPAPPVQVAPVQVAPTPKSTLDLAWELARAATEVTAALTVGDRHRARCGVLAALAAARALDLVLGAKAEESEAA